MNREEAIKECKELWREIKKSGLSKLDFLYLTEKGRGWLAKNYFANCPLCDFVKSWCPLCPLVEQYGGRAHTNMVVCAELGYRESSPSSPGWFEAIEGLK